MIFEVEYIEDVLVSRVEAENEDSAKVEFLKEHERADILSVKKVK